MNILEGTIKSVESAERSSIVEVDVKGDSLFVILLETQKTTGRLQVGRQVSLLFKETEVVVGKEPARSSLLNRLAAKISSLHQGTILSEVEMDYKGESVTAIIPSRSVKELDLKAKDSVFWYVKINEVTLQWNA